MITMAPRVTISQELYDHLKDKDGTIAKNLDNMILGKTTKSAPKKAKKRKFPESHILYSSILNAFNPIEPKPLSRRDILEHVNKDLAKTSIPKEFPSWYNQETNLSWRSRFSTTIDNRLLTLIRSKRIKREDGLFYLARD
tara:strand:+ start:618 stop:1037 length:420 start_codon:yes stop_codon:yes gene_type:complete